MCWFGINFSSVRGKKEYNPTRVYKLEFKFPLFYGWICGFYNLMYQNICFSYQIMKLRLWGKNCYL